MFERIFFGAIQSGRFANSAAEYLFKNIPGSWSVRERADPELFEGIGLDEYEQQDPKIVREDLPGALYLTNHFTQATSKFEEFMGGNLTDYMNPKTVIDPALAALTSAKGHLDPTIPENNIPDKPAIPEVDTPELPEVK